MKKTKIALIAPNKLPIPSVQGGAIETLSTYLIDQNEKFININFDVFSYSNSIAETLSRSYKNSTFYFFKPNFIDDIFDFIFRITYHIFGRKYYTESSFIRFVKKILRKNDYDYILVEGNFLQVAKFHNLNIPIIYHLHTDILNKKEPMTKRVVRCSDKILVISKYLKNQISEAVGKTEKIKIFKNAINLSDFKLGDNDKLSAKLQLGLDPQKRVMIYCGRVTPIKGVLEAIQAFRKANPTNLTFLIVGGSNFADSTLTEYERTLQRYATDYNLDVVFTGYVPHADLAKYYSAADFSICPSVCNEAAGLVIIEAMASGIPVIASKRGGIPEYVNSDCCILVDPEGDFIGNLSKAISIFGNREKLPEVSIDSLKEYSAENYYNNFLEIICKQ